MIKFISEDVRLLFHSLPVEKQGEWIDVAAGYEKRGQNLTVLFVDQEEDGTLEVSVRIDKKLHIVPG